MISLGRPDDHSDIDTARLVGAPFGRVRAGMIASFRSRLDPLELPDEPEEEGEIVLALDRPREDHESRRAHERGRGRSPSAGIRTTSVDAHGSVPPPAPCDPRRPGPRIAPHRIPRCGKDARPSRVSVGHSDRCGPLRCASAPQSRASWRDGSATGDPVARARTLPGRGSLAAFQRIVRGRRLSLTAGRPPAPLWAPTLPALSRRGWRAATGGRSVSGLTHPGPRLPAGRPSGG